MHTCIASDFAKQMQIQLVGRCLLVVPLISCGALRRTVLIDKQFREQVWCLMCAQAEDVRTWPEMLCCRK